jgi:hypothetical protein
MRKGLAMLRYRIERDENGRYFVLPAVAWIVPVAETYATCAEARETADWFNGRGKTPRTVAAPPIRHYPRG